MKIYKKILDIFVKIVSELLMLLIGGIVLIMLSELFLRNVLNSSFRASTELCGFLFMWMAFMGIVVLYDNNAMISLDMFSSRMKEPVSTVCWFLNKFFSLGLGVVMVFSYKQLYPVISTSMFSTMQFLSKAWHFLPMALAGAFIAMKTLYEILERIMNRKQKSAQ